MLLIINNQYMILFIYLFIYCPTVFMLALSDPRETIHFNAVFFLALFNI